MFQPLDDPFRFFELAFPNGDDFPAELFEVAGVVFIVGDVALKLLFPEGLVAFWSRGVFAAFVPVPETAVDKDDGFILWQNNVRLAGEAFDILPEAVSGAVQQRADENFRLRILPANPRHIP